MKRKKIIEYENKTYTRYCNCNSEWSKDTDDEKHMEWVHYRDFNECKECCCYYWIRLREGKSKTEEVVTGRRIRIRR
jgi:hypothetical protein